MYKFQKTPEFDKWISSEPLKSRLQIEDRLLRIACDGHFGVNKYLTENIWELKWTNGRRIYYAYLAEYNILLLLGENKNGQSKDIIKILGENKNGQSKDIIKTKKILRKYTEAAP